MTTYQIDTVPKEVTQIIISNQYMGRVLPYTEIHEGFTYPRWLAELPDGRSDCFVSKLDAINELIRENMKYNNTIRVLNEA